MNDSEEARGLDVAALRAFIGACEDVRDDGPEDGPGQHVVMTPFREAYARAEESLFAVLALAESRPTSVPGVERQPVSVLVAEHGEAAVEQSVVSPAPATDAEALERYGSQRIRAIDAYLAKETAGMQALDCGPIILAWNDGWFSAIVLGREGAQTKPLTDEQVERGLEAWYLVVDDDPTRMRRVLAALTAQQEPEGRNG